MLDERWRLWVENHENGGPVCGDRLDNWEWPVACNLPPGHDLPHEDRRGYGTVVHAQWPWKPHPETTPEHGDQEPRQQT